MYNKKEWVNDEIITKEALNNIENGIADLDDKMNDVATKKELQTIENNVAVLDDKMNDVTTGVAENNNELNELKEGLVASLVALGHKVDMNSDWKDLFAIVLTGSGSGSVPDVPNPDVPSGDGVYLVKGGEPQYNTVFAKACLPVQYTSSNSTLHFSLGKSDSGGSHTWFSYDGYVNFNHYDRIEITLRTEKSTQRPNLIVARTLSSGTYGYMAAAGYDYEELTTEMVMTTTTMTKYTFNIDDMVGDRTSNARNGYLLIHMNGGDSTESGEIYIQDIVVYPKETETPENKECTSIRFTESSLNIHIDQVTDLKEILVIQPDGCTDPVEWVADNTLLEINNGVIKGLAEGSTKVQARCGGLSANINITVVSKILEDSGEGILLYKAGVQNNDTEFRNLCLTNAQNSLTSNAICYELNVSKPHVWFSYDGFVNFDDYDRVEITAYTEKSTQQPVLGLGITSKSGQCGHEGSSNWDGTPHTNLTLMYNVTETKYSLPINYTGSGYLLLWMNHANSALGRVYITEIRVIPKKTNDPIEIVDDEITIQVGERYDATRLYTLQEGYNVQYKYTSIIAIENDHTIVGKEVGTTELEIVCGGLIKTVTVNVI